MHRRHFWHSSGRDLTIHNERSLLGEICQGAELGRWRHNAVVALRQLRTSRQPERRRMIDVHLLRYTQTTEAQ